ncbi:DNA-processing protein DprA [Phocaeicola plebeius]|uniref:DNA-processing protein DprA n=1 Tax=Phocaeicola plebeius TaxID=310297 RepID=UPI0029433087|nr:DNA-processing protein DprA [Phocaeicola plebeius]
MKGYVSHLITENEKLEQELTADYDAAHAPVSHQQLLALQLRGDIDELSVCIHDCVSLVPMVKDLPADLLEEAGRILARQQAMGIRTVSFLDEMSYTCRLNELDIFRPILLHGMGDWSLLDMQPSVSVTGSPQASPQDVSIAREWGKKYGSGHDGQEFCIVVGSLANLCDVAAMEGCLNAGGNVIAIMEGLDGVATYALCRRIVDEGGLVISTQWIGASSGRNLCPCERLVAVLCEQMIVVECQQQNELMTVVEEARKLGRGMHYVKPAVHDISMEGIQVLPDKKPTVKKCERIFEWADKPYSIVYKIIAVYLQYERITCSGLIDKLKTLHIATDPYGSVHSLMTDKGNSYGRVFMEENGFLVFVPEVRERIEAIRGKFRV